MLGESKTLAWGFAMAPHRLRALVEVKTTFLNPHMTSCRIESIFSFPSLFWKTKTKSEIQIGITFLIIVIF